MRAAAPGHQGATLPRLPFRVIPQLGFALGVLTSFVQRDGQLGRELARSPVPRARAPGPPGSFVKSSIGCVAGMLAEVV